MYILYVHIYTRGEYALISNYAFVCTHMHQMHPCAFVCIHVHPLHTPMHPHASIYLHMHPLYIRIAIADVRSSRTTRKSPTRPNRGTANGF